MRERPQCRKQIVKLGLRPLYATSGGRVRYAALDCCGNRTSLTTGMVRQLEKMLREGYFESADYIAAVLGHQVGA